jgi:hypothetical protein
VVFVQDERSQHKNRARALALLRSRLYDAERSAKDQSRAADRRAQVGSGDRSERIRTYNFPQGPRDDHRINLTLYKIEEIMAGRVSTRSSTRSPPSTRRLCWPPRGWADGAGLAGPQTMLPAARPCPSFPRGRRPGVRDIFAKAATRPTPALDARILCRRGARHRAVRPAHTARDADRR